MAALPREATEAAVATVASSRGIRMFPGTPLWESCKESSSIMLKPANYSNLENFAFDANYSNLENYARGLPIKTITPTLCIYKIFTDNFVVSWASKDLKAGCVKRPKRARDGSNKQETL
jgi:hypothetical protein